MLTEHVCVDAEYIALVVIIIHDGCWLTKAALVLY